jgi:hypothetical protein
VLLLVTILLVCLFKKKKRHHHHHPPPPPPPHLLHYYGHPPPPPPPPPPFKGEMEMDTSKFLLLALSQRRYTDLLFPFCLTSNTAARRCYQLKILLNCCHGKCFFWIY